MPVKERKRILPIFQLRKLDDAQLVGSHEHFEKEVKEFATNGLGECHELPFQFFLELGTIQISKILPFPTITREKLTLVNHVNFLVLLPLRVFLLPGWLSSLGWISAGATCHDDGPTSLLFLSAVRSITSSQRNKKISRNFGKHTAEIRQNLERGTAL
jgi:hypothetical protein